jgi:hypothetical protein
MKLTLLLAELAGVLLLQACEKSTDSTSVQTDAQNDQGSVSDVATPIEDVVVPSATDAVEAGDEEAAPKDQWIKYPDKDADTFLDVKDASQPPDSLVEPDVVNDDVKQFQIGIPWQPQPQVVFDPSAPGNCKYEPLAPPVDTTCTVAGEFRCSEVDQVSADWVSGSSFVPKPGAAAEFGKPCRRTNVVRCEITANGKRWIQRPAMDLWPDGCTPPASAAGAWCQNTPSGPRIEYENCPGTGSCSAGKPCPTGWYGKWGCGSPTSLAACLPLGEALQTPYGKQLQKSYSQNTSCLDEFVRKHTVQLCNISNLSELCAKKVKVPGLPPYDIVPSGCVPDDIGGHCATTCSEMGLKKWDPNNP